MEQHFLSHKHEFEILLADIQSDINLKMIGIGKLRYADCFMQNIESITEVESLGIAKDRWLGCQKRLKELGIMMVLNESGSVEFKIDSESLLNGDSSKGYLFSSVPPRNQRESLDDYRISVHDKTDTGGYVVHKPIAKHANWYLYLYVN
jgi:hypothetical protein